MKTFYTLRLLIYTLIFGISHSSDDYGDVPSCSSPIYCHGPLLDAVQRANLFKDSKTFVDLNLKDSPGNVLRAFNILNQHGNITKDEIQQFVQQYFSGPGEEFEVWQPSDYVRNPRFLENVKDQYLKDFGWDMCSVWKDLGRKIKEDVKLNPDRYSLMHLPNPFIVPGGRFRETYYWDSYWVVRGLLVCEMNITVKGMLENFVHQVDVLGHVPNGGRIYYARRSQPPFLIPMVNEYYEQTNDLDLIKQNIDILEMEYNFWMKNRTVTVWKDEEQYSMNRYGPINNQPRPESYREDLETANGLDKDTARVLFNNLAAAAESGWDFSSRWFSDVEDPGANLQTTITTDIIPVDLNSILCLNERLLAKFYKMLGNTTKEKEFIARLENRIKAVNTILWNQESGMWLDYSINKNASRNYFFPSNVFPMFTDCLEENGDRRAKQEQSVVEHFKSQRIFRYKGGIPTSFQNTGQQWDYTNGWPPLQHVMIWSLDKSNIAEAKQLAIDLAQSWIESNWKGWIRTRNMFEKYDVSNPGSRGGGGEYDVQEGFGWSNGIVLDILKKYGKILSVAMSTDITGSGCSTDANPFYTVANNGQCPAGCQPAMNKCYVTQSSYKVLLLSLVFIMLSCLSHMF